MATPYSIRIFQLDGDPNGVRTIEKSNWTGQGLAFPRALLAEASKRKELKRTGVYVLFGESDQSSFPAIYVGEGDPILNRLRSHDASKDFWTFGVSFTSKDESLNKAHVQYLESRLIGLASASKRCVIQNGNEPELPSLSEADQADAEAFLQEMLLCLPSIGMGMFQQRASNAVSSAELLHIDGKGVKASGVDTPEGFLVKKGSRASKQDTPTTTERTKVLRSNLLSMGVLREDPDAYVFLQDYLFNSSSSASNIILARYSSGPSNWKNSSGKSLGEIQSA
jgi:hypothetical protein